MLLQSERGSWRGGLRHRSHCSSPKIASPDSVTPVVRSISSTSSETESGSDDESFSVVTREGAKKEVACDSKVVYEFGGPVGVTALMFGFPILMSYMFICLALHQGRLPNPLELEFWQHGISAITPTARATAIYLMFNLFQYITAATLPGIKVLGLPVPSLGGKQLEYLCNGVATWYFDLVLVAVLHNTGVFPITAVVDEIGPIMSVAMIWAIIVTIATYIVGCVSGRTHRMSGSVPYDIFMGAVLNPRIGNVDLKMWSEIRIPWKILFFISLSAAVKDHEINVARRLEAGLSPEIWSLFGGLIHMNAIQTSAPLLFMLLAHCLYVNACMKGEECIPTTWDIFYEKWGYMLIFWNLAGVPFSYCYSTLYLLNRSVANDPVQHTRFFMTVLFVILLAAYYVWDTANSQKNRFRMQQRGRDHIHCKEKYGADFDEYCRQVPYIFIPFIF